MTTLDTLKTRLAIRLRGFRQSTDGAITVDWVVLSAAVIGIGVVVINTIGFTTDSAANKTADKLNTIKSGYGQNVME